MTTSYLATVHGSASEFEKKKQEARNDIRPVGARRPRYAANGDVGEREGVSELKERSCGAEDGDSNGDDR